MIDDPRFLSKTIDPVASLRNLRQAPDIFFHEFTVKRRSPWFRRIAIAFGVLLVIAGAVAFVFWWRFRRVPRERSALSLVPANSAVVAFADFDPAFSDEARAVWSKALVGMRNARQQDPVAQSRFQSLRSRCGFILFQKLNFMGVALQLSPQGAAPYAVVWGDFPPDAVARCAHAYADLYLSTSLQFLRVDRDATVLSTRVRDTWWTETLAPLPSLKPVAPSSFELVVHSQGLAFTPSNSSLDTLAVLRERQRSAESNPTLRAAYEAIGPKPFLAAIVDVNALRPMLQDTMQRVPSESPARGFLSALEGVQWIALGARLDKTNLRLMLVVQTSSQASAQNVADLLDGAQSLARLSTHEQFERALNRVQSSSEPLSRWLVPFMQSGFERIERATHRMHVATQGSTVRLETTLYESELVDLIQWFFGAGKFLRTWFAPGPQTSSIKLFRLHMS